MTDLIKKHKEIIMYVIFGALAFVISVVSFYLFNVVFGVNELIANFISWNLAVIFAFFTNRRWVFEADEKKETLFKQLISFYAGRIVTLIIEELIIYVFITRLNFASVPVKIVAQVVVIILNYVISKFFVFKKKETTEE